MNNPSKPNKTRAALADKPQKAVKKATAPAAGAKVPKPVKAAKPGKPALPAAKKKDKAQAEKKPKLVRDSYSLPKDEYAALNGLKQRSATLGLQVKKNSLLRAGLQALAKLSDTALLEAVRALPETTQSRAKSSDAPKPAKAPKSVKAAKAPKTQSTAPEAQTGA